MSSPLPEPDTPTPIDPVGEPPIDPVGEQPIDPVGEQPIDSVETYPLREYNGAPHPAPSAVEAIHKERHRTSL